MADVSKIKFPSGNTYDIKDAVARAGLANIPTKTSDLTNDSGFITSSDIPEGAAASDADPLMDGVKSAGSSNAFARGDHRHPSDTSKANVANPSFTGAVSISHLNKIITIHPDGLIEMVDNGSSPSIGSEVTLPQGSFGDVLATEAYVTSAIVNKADKATTLAGYGITDAYTKGQADSAIASAIAAALTGEFVVSASLPTASASTMGKIYLIPATNGSGTNVKDEYITWNDNGTYKWEKIGTTDVDLSGLGGLAYKDVGDIGLTVMNKSALGANTTFATTGSSVTFDGGTTDTFVKSYPGATSKLVTTSVPNVTSAGSASTWSFAMGSGADAETLIISGTNGSAPTLGTAITAATGALASNGGGASVMTGLGTASTGSAVTSIGSGSVAPQSVVITTQDTVNAVTSVAIDIA